MYSEQGGGRFPTILLQGNAVARGHRYGEVCRPLIHASCHYYIEEVFRSRGCTLASLRDYAAQCAEVVAVFNPEALQEMQAIAEGAELPAWQILALNARTEILNVAARTAAQECTAFYMKDGAILAQNWDWIRIGLEAAVVLDVRTDDGRAASILTEAGMLGKIGLNSHGLGVCLNILQAPHDRIGVPVAVLSRVVLDVATVKDARLLLTAAGNQRATHFLVADAHGECVSMEYLGSSAHEVEVTDGVLVHTNHAIARQARVQMEAVAGSLARYARVRELCSFPGPATVERAKQILSDQKEELCFLNVPWRNSQFMPGEQISTCAGIVMDLAARTMHVRKGFDLNAPWTSYHPQRQPQPSIETVGAH